VLFILHQCRHENKIKPKYIEKLMDLDARKSIIKPIILKKTLIVLGIVVCFFFIHDKLGLPTSVVALFGASSILLLVAPHDNPQKYLKKLELSVFLFFSSLFIIVG
jgi:Na+/H+ antiporter NhaD/arsenite permease-like protein